MKREDLKVGCVYKGRGTGSIRRVLYIGNTELFFENDGQENIYSVKGFLIDHELIPVEPDLYFYWEYREFDGCFGTTTYRYNKEFKRHNGSSLGGLEESTNKRILKSLGAVDKDGRYYEWSNGVWRVEVLDD